MGLAKNMGLRTTYTLLGIFFTDIHLKGQSFLNVFCLYCSKKKKDSQQVYRFSFDVNPSDIVELDARLGDCILHDPLKASSLFQSVCLQQLFSLSGMIQSLL